MSDGSVATAADRRIHRELLRLQAAGGNQMVVRLLQSAGSGGELAGDDLAARIRARLGAGEALPAAVRAGVGASFGDQLGDVRLHRDGEAASLADELDARAFTVGRDVFFGAGAYDPASSEGDAVLAHELAHTVQQSSGPVAGRQLAPDLIVSEPGDRDERAASATAERVLAQQAAAPSEVRAGPALPGVSPRESPLSVQRCGDHVSQGCSCAGSTSGLAGDEGEAEPGVPAVHVRRWSLEEFVHDVEALGARVEGGAEQAFSDFSSAAGREAVAAATTLVGAFGGSVSVSGAGLRIDVPEIPLFGPEQTPLVAIPVPPFRLPLLVAGAEIGPLLLEADVAIEVVARPEVIAVLGPASIKDVHVILDPGSGNYTAAGRLHLAASETVLAPIEAGLDLEVMAVLVVEEAPVPVEIDAFGGLRLTLRGSGLGSLDENVSLGYRAGSLFLDALTDLRLGARLDATLDAILEINLYQTPVCVYTWPLAQWDLGETAEQFSLPLSLSYGPSGPAYRVGPATMRPIPVRDIQAVVPRLPVTRDCRFLDNLIAVLCSRGVLPPELCRTGAASGPPGALGFGPGHGGVGPAAGVPSGLSPNNKDDHIPITWFKPESAYPDPVPLIDSTGAPHDYEMTTPGQQVEPGHDIGVVAAFLPEPGKSVQLVFVIEEEDRGPAVDRFRSLLNRHGWTDGATHDIDHVQDIGWDGPDDPENLWPLESGRNRSAGSRFQQMLLTYSNVRGGGPATPSTTNVRLVDAARASGADNVLGRWFIIREIRG